MTLKNGAFPSIQEKFFASITKGSMHTIFRCKSFGAYPVLDKDCCGIIRSQENHPQAQINSIDDLQVPEPWRGDLENAPLLFVSSNPSCDPTDSSPKWSDSDEDIRTYFQNGLGDCFPYIRIGKSISNKPVNFWSEILGRAAELYQIENPRNFTQQVRQAGQKHAQIPEAVLSKIWGSFRPGHKFAITEVVHCKSVKNIGTREAADQCFKNHWNNLIQTSGAKIVIILGEIAKNKFLSTHPKDTQGNDIAELWNNSKNVKNEYPKLTPAKIETNGRETIFVWLPQPNTSSPRTFDARYPDHLTYLREVLSTDHHI